MSIDLNQFKQPLENISFTSEASAYLEEIQKNLDQDFTPAHGGHFSHRDMQLLVNKSAHQLSERLRASLKTPIDFETLRREWAVVVTDYHRNDNWGFVSQKMKPKPILTDDQKVFRELLPYFGLIVLIGFVCKIAFFYYGMHNAADPTPESKFWLIVTLIIFFGSMFYFAWKKSK